MAGKHMELLESLERRLNLVEINLSNIDLQVAEGNDTNKRLKKMIKSLLRQQPDGKSVGYSSGENSATVSDSEKDENPTYNGVPEDTVPEEQRPRGHHREDRRCNWPKLTCPTFKGDDPISWIS
ncbi:hypothetical protein ACS0TY_032003 [Phlomoides rotata]